MKSCSEVLHTKTWQMVNFQHTITDRIRRMREGNVFTGVCLSTEGYPSIWSHVPTESLVEGAFLAQQRGCPSPSQGMPQSQLGSLSQPGRGSPDWVPLVQTVVPPWLGLGFPPTGIGIPPPHAVTGQDTPWVLRLLCFHAGGLSC